jgi:hypothetical protein
MWGMAKRSIVFPAPKELVNIAGKTGLRLDVLWELIETALAERPRRFSIAIRGPRKTVTIKLKRDPRKLRKQTFDDEGFFIFGPQTHEISDEVERDEDAGKGSEPRGTIIDENNISDMSPASIGIRNRTPQPLTEEEIPKPRYPISPERQNRFLTEEMRQKRNLFREKWAKLNRTHSWPSWLVCDDNDHFAGQVLQWKYPKLLVSESERFQAALTLEAINVYFRGHNPSADSPMFEMSDKAIAKRVERFLREAARFLEIEERHHEAETTYDSAKAEELVTSWATPEARQDDLDEDIKDPVVQLWRKRLDDDE